MQGFHLSDIIRGRNTASNPNSSLLYSLRVPVLTPPQQTTMTEKPKFDVNAIPCPKQSTSTRQMASHICSSPAQLQIIHIDRAISLLKKQHEAIMSSIHKQTPPSADSAVANLHFNELDPLVSNSISAPHRNFNPQPPGWSALDPSSGLISSSFDSTSQMNIETRKRRMDVDCNSLMLPPACKRRPSAR